MSHTQKSKFTLSRLCLAAGLLLLLAAAVLTGYNLYTDWHAGQTAQTAASQLASSQPQTQTPVSESSSVQAKDFSGPMPQQEIDGAYYVGTLELPTLGLTLPIRAEWSTAGAKTAPCRYLGSAYDGDLIIAGHNYRSHFGRLAELQLGDEVRFTDVEGNVFRYEVASFESIDMYDIEAMEEGDWDLTLFTCDASRVRRVTVRCTALDAA